MGAASFGIIDLSKVLLLTSLAIASGCSRPVGDFGRAQDSVIHDKVQPQVGRVLALRRKEAVSAFARTDEEVRLEDLAWTIIRPLHTKDWISGTLLEGRRNRIFPEINHRLDFRAYLKWLKLERFRSSETRWNRLIADIRADQAAVAPFYGQARLVYAIDQQRVAFLEREGEFDRKYRQNTRARLVENETMIRRALESMQFRYNAYDHAIKHMILEFPSPRAAYAEVELERYGDLVERGGKHGLPYLPDAELLSSRITKEDVVVDEEPVLLK